MPSGSAEPVGAQAHRQRRRAAGRVGADRRHREAVGHGHRDRRGARQPAVVGDPQPDAQRADAVDAVGGVGWCRRRTARRRRGPRRRGADRRPGRWRSRAERDRERRVARGRDGVVTILAVGPLLVTVTVVCAVVVPWWASSTCTVTTCGPTPLNVACRAEPGRVVVGAVVVGVPRVGQRRAVRVAGPRRAQRGHQRRAPRRRVRRDHRGRVPVRDRDRDGLGGRAAAVVGDLDRGGVRPDAGVRRRGGQPGRVVELRRRRRCPRRR